MPDSKYSGLYRDVFNLHKNHFPPHGWNDTEYWNAFDRESLEIFRRHGETTFARDLLTAVYEELERTVDGV